MRAVLDDHMAAAVLTDLIRLFVFDPDVLQFLLSSLDCLVQIRIEVFDDDLPVDLAVSDAVQ